MFGYSLEVPQWGTSKENPQFMFSLRNKNNINTFWLKKKPHLIWRYDGIITNWTAQNNSTIENSNLKEIHTEISQSWKDMLSFFSTQTATNVLPPKITNLSQLQIRHLFNKKVVSFSCTLCGLLVWRFYGPVNSVESCRAWSIYLTTLLLGRLCHQSG